MIALGVAFSYVSGHCFGLHPHDHTQILVKDRSSQNSAKYLPGFSKKLTLMLLVYHEPVDSVFQGHRHLLIVACKCRHGRPLVQVARFLQDTVSKSTCVISIGAKQLMIKKRTVSWLGTTELCIGDILISFYWIIHSSSLAMSKSSDFLRRACVYIEIAEIQT